MPESLARVATGAAPRYAKQFASHFGRKIPVEETPDGGHRLTSDKTDVVLHPADDHLLVEVTAPTRRRSPPSRTWWAAISNASAVATS
ncbi:DUF2218 domain-containing protein [Streptomyces sp. NPDC093591]|uniref:DUF2218 domain-containing protein n=1 Tax=Streptomyces sp. NPDC093591 TaxID=3366044 RepID=UPI0037F30EBF